MQYRKFVWIMILCLAFGSVSPAAVSASSLDSSTDSIETAAPEVNSTEAKETEKITEAAAEQATSGDGETEPVVVKPLNPYKPGGTSKKPASSKPSDTSAPSDSSDSSNASSASNASNSSNSAASSSSSSSSSSRPGFLTETGEEGSDMEGDGGHTGLTPEEQASENAAAAEEAQAGSNQQLIDMQNIVMPDLTDMDLEFRFFRDTEAERIFLPRGTQVHEGKSEEARVLGESLTGSLAYILADGNKEWVYVESGITRGFVKKTEIISWSAFMSGRNAMNMGETVPADGYMDVYMDVFPLIDPMNNQVLTYTNTTASDPVVADPDPVLASMPTVNIYDRKDITSAEAVVVGTMDEGSLAYCLADRNDAVVYVESGDVRGFVDSEQLAGGKRVKAIVEEVGAETFPMAQEIIAPAANSAIHHTVTSVKEASDEARFRSALVEFSLQFLGGSYVWGGKNIETGGVDCSGFVKEMYRFFNMKIPTCSRSQARYGVQIPVEAALPGDLIFYAKEGKVVHVSMYVGDGMTIHAKGSKWGIVVTPIASNAVWATRVIGTEYAVPFNTSAE